jgi:hypothetical protein
MGLTDTIHVTLRPSPLLRSLNVVLHGTALLIAGAMALHRPGFWLACLGIGLFAWHGERRLSLRLQNVPVGFRWAADQRLHWQAGDGRWMGGECIEARCWAAFWIRLRVREPGRWLRRTLIVPADAVDAEVHRRLRVRCRVAPPGRAV